MATVRYRPPITSARGGFYNRRFTGLTKSGLDVKLSANQHAQLLVFNPRTATHTTTTVTQLRDRFTQLECMWQLLTPGQRKLWEYYARDLNDSDKRALTPVQRFRSLGLTTRFGAFITKRLKAKYTLRLMEETDDYYIIRLRLKTRPNPFETPINVRPYY